MIRSSVTIAMWALLAACGGQTQGTTDAGNAGAPDGGASDVAAADGSPGDGAPAQQTGFITALHADNSLCLPQALPVDAQGQVACTVYELPPAPGTCDASLGLSGVDPATAASVRTAAQAPSSQTVCQLAQLPEGDWVSGSCVQSTEAGWCYVAGAAAGGSCAQALRFSASGLPASGVDVLLGCR